MGHMGAIHANNLLQMEDVTVSALCSLPIAEAEAFAKEHRLNCGVYDDAHEMLAREKLDAIYVCLPPFAHNGQIEEAASRGIHIFVEKPIALTPRRAESMVNAVLKNRVQSQVGYHMRFGGAVRRFRELHQNGEPGKITLFSASYECNSLHGAWWRKKDMSGGQVFEQVIHLYDMAFHLLGDPASVSGHIANLLHQDVEGYTVEDTSVASLVFKNGALGSITGSNCALPNEWNARFRVVCANMIADFEDHNHATIIYTNKPEPIRERLSYGTNAVLDEDRYFVGVLNGIEKPFATIEEGYRGLMMVHGLVKSAASGRIVSFD